MDKLLFHILHLFHVLKVLLHVTILILIYSCFEIYIRWIKFNIWPKEMHLIIVTEFLIWRSVMQTNDKKNIDESYGKFGKRLWSQGANDVLKNTICKCKLIFFIAHTLKLTNRMIHYSRWEKKIYGMKVTVVNVTSSYSGLE